MKKLYYDTNIEKYFTFSDIKKMFEEATETSATIQEIINFIDENLIQNGGDLVAVSLSDLLEDAEHGDQVAIEFLGRLGGATA